MNSERIMQSDVLDILFEKRNKAYGAYTLRKFYNNRLLTSVCIMVAAVITFSAFTFLPGSSGPDSFIVTEPVFGRVLTEQKLPEVKPPLVRRVIIPPVSTLQFETIFIFVDTKDSSDNFRDLNDNLAVGNTTNILTNDSGTYSIVPPASGNGDITAAAKPEETIVDVTKPIDNPEVMPQFPGGMDALRNFLMRNLDNPRELEETEVINVKVTFVVGYDGKLKHFELIQDGGSEFNNEVIRVLKKMPIWIPGKSKGQNVAVYYTIPVKFIP